MNKVLVFTNAERWNEFNSNLFHYDEPEWDDRIQNIENDMVYKCIVDTRNKAILQPTDDISGEGVYLVYDEIDAETLKNMLLTCKNDIIYMLYHSNGINPSDIKGLDLNWVKGSHTPNSYYNAVFRFLIDEKPDKTERIIKVLGL